MKRLFTFLTLLALGCILAHAEDYGLKIVGKDITSSGNIDAGQTTGTISWNGDNNELTFTNVTANNTSGSAFVSFKGSGSITLRFIGNNTITSSQTIIRSSSSASVYIYGELNKTGRLTLTMNDNAGEGGCPIWVSGNLQIGRLYLNATGKNYAITGGGSNSISFDETILDARTTMGSNGALCDFASASFNQWDAYLITGSFNKEKKAVCDGGGTPLSRVRTDASLLVDGAIVGIGYTQPKRVYPSGLKAGTITYSYDDKTLTLDGVNMKCVGGSYAIVNKKLSGLTIKVKGTNTIDASSNWGIFSHADITVEGDGTTYTDNNLIFTNAYGPLCLWLSDGDKSSAMTLKYLTLSAPGSNVGIYCTASGGLSGTLNIETCMLVAEITGTSSDYGGIHGFTACNLKDCSVNTAATPVYYNTAKKSTTDVSGTPNKRVVINVPAEVYDLSVLGNSVNTLNASNILVDGLAEGKITYVASAKRLILDNVTLTATEGNMETGLTIRGNSVEEILLRNSNKITTSGYVINDNADNTITMTGSGSFTGKSTGSSALTMNGSMGFVVDVDGGVFFDGKERGIWGNGGNYASSTVTLKQNTPNSDYYFRGHDNGAIVNVADFKFEGMDFFYSDDYGTPGCYFDERYVRQNGGKVVAGDDMVNVYGIDQDYGIIVAGVPVTSCNCRAVGSKYITGGGPKAVSFDNVEDMLTLDNATIDYSGDDKAFQTLETCGIELLNIRLVGDNTISTTGSLAARIGGGSVDKPVTTKITGDGSLQATSSWYAIMVDNYSTLDIGDKATVRAEGTATGIGNNMNGDFGETLIIREDAHLEAKGDINAICRLNGIQLLDGNKILKPAGAEIAKEQFGWGIFVDGKPTTEVVIGKRLKGDVNGDGSIDVADISTIIDVMAGKALEFKDAADVNGDHNVDVADVSTVIDIMAGKDGGMGGEE